MDLSSSITDSFETPLGLMHIACTRTGKLTMAEWDDGRADILKRLQGSLERVRDPFGLTAALERYFQGDIGVIDSLPVAMTGTDFQNTVWKELRRIPAGSTISYGELARRIGNPKGMRAVGLANGSNPVGVVVPCHRVIGSSGKLTGYGGGLHRKKWLLEHEGRLTSPLFRASAGDTLAF